MRTRSVAVLFLFLFTVFSTLWAQTFRGSIQGTVIDSTGAAVAAAQVKIANAATGFSRVVSTNDQGEYVAPELPLGSYSVTVTKEGFRTTTLNQVPVSVGVAQRADVKMAAGEVKEVVQVNADLPLVETASNTTGGTIEGAQAAELPVNGRDFTKLLELVPGTASDPVGSTESAGSYGLFSINGNRGRSNNYLLDGTDMNDGYRNLPSINQAGVWGCPSTILPIDALAEVPVTASPDAEFGRSSGATVNLVTKSGTNQIHGSVFEYYRNDALGARNYFNTADQPKNSFHNHQFGGSIGGPLVKDKTFWFLSYEGQREDGGLPQFGTVPTQEAISSFSGTTDPVIAKLLSMNPWGTLPTSGDGTVRFTTPFSNRIDSLIVKMDQRLHWFSDSDLLTGRYFYGNSDQLFPLGMLDTGSTAPSYETYTPTHVNIVSLSYTTVPKSNMVVEIRGGYNRFLQGFYPEDRTFDPTSIGLNTLPPDANLTHDLGLPTINISGYSTIGAGPSDARGRIDTNYQLFGNVSLTKGSHNFKWGYEWRRTFINSFINSGHRGVLNFNSLDDFLAGTIASGSSATGSATRYTYQNNSGLYLQDSWRATSKLTLNYGIRWDYFGVIGAKDHAFSLFDPANGGSIVSTNQLYPRDLNNFAPRLSLAYDVTGKGKLVVRAGYGIFYDGASQDFFVGNQPWNTSAAQAGPAFNNIKFATSTAGTVSDPSDPTNANWQIFSGYEANSAFTVAQNLSTPIYQSYNLNVETQIASKLAAQIGYVGSQGRHLFRFRDINQANPLTGAPSPYPQYWYINQVETSAASNYNSLQATLKMQNWHGLTSTLNYTWAHSIDDASDGLDFVPNAAMPDNSLNPSAERASSNFDVRHHLQWYWSYNLPKYQTAKWLTNGWALDGMFNFATGQPYTVSFWGNYNGTGEYFGRPDIVGDPYAGTHGPSQYLNMAAFAAPCTWDAAANDCVPGTQHPGNEGRNAFRAPNFTNFDFSVTKTSHLTERLTMQLRADLFNILNHANFSNPLMPNFSAFMPTDFATNPTKPSQAIGQGSLPIQATPDVGTGNPFLGGGGPRTAQLAVRFSF